MEKTIMKRIEEVDIMKGMGIVFIVVGHLGSICPDFLHAYIYSFHMPLFFFVTGLFAKRCSGFKMMGKLVKKKFIQLLLPYIIYSFLFYVIDALIKFKKYNYQDYINTLCGSDSFGFLWFLFTLFFVSVYFYFLTLTTRNEKILMIIVFMSAVIAFTFSKLGLFERMGSILFSTMFFYAGYYLNGMDINNVKNMLSRKVTLVLLCIVSIIGTYVITILSGDLRISLDIHHNLEVDVLLTDIVAFSGIGLTFVVASILNHFAIVGRLMSYMGRNSIIFYPIITYFPLRMEHMLGISSAFGKIGTKLAAFVLGIAISMIREGIRKKNKKISGFY